MKLKNIILLFLVIVVCILTSGCFKRDAMENIEIITTAYPIEYVVNKLYKDNSTITSIYPKGTKIDKYKLTEKQIKDYSKKQLFIYNGLTDEKNYAKKMLNYNNNLKIIDASYGIDYDYSPSELWLNPSHMLMLANNIETELESYISNPYIIDEIRTRHEQFKLDISELDSIFKTTAINSQNKTIVTADETLKFIEKYGFEVINITEKNKIIDKNLIKAKSLYDNKEVSYLFIMSNKEILSEINNFINDNNLPLLTIIDPDNLTDKDLENNEDYLSIMNTNIEIIKKETY